MPITLPDRGYIRKDFLSQIWDNSCRLAGRNNNWVGYVVVDIPILIGKEAETLVNEDLDLDMHYTIPVHVQLHIFML